MGKNRSNHPDCIWTPKISVKWSIIPRAQNEITALPRYIHVQRLKRFFSIGKTFIFLWVVRLPTSWRNGCNIAVLIYSLPRQLLLKAPHHNLQFSNSVIFLSNGAWRPAKETDTIILGKVQNFKSHFATPAEVKGLNLVGECDRAWQSVLLVCNSLS